MDITQLLHDEIMSHRELQIGHPELLPWTQERIDALYTIKQVMDHTPETHTSQKNTTGQKFNLPRVHHG